MRFVLVGTGRCGTTLLLRMLNRHPDLFVMRESHWIPKMFEHYGAGTAPVEDLLRIVLHTTHVTGARVLECDEATLRSWFAGSGDVRVADFCDRIGERFAARDGKAHWADKTPDYGPWLTQVQTLWPRCRILHLIRDGRAVAASMTRHPGFQWLASAGEVWWPPVSFNEYHRSVAIREPSFEACAELWERRLSRTRDELTRVVPGSALEVRFEALVEQPAAVLQTISRFLDLPAPVSWLEAAAADVDPGRLTATATADLFDRMGERPKRLMRALGYAPPGAATP